MKKSLLLKTMLLLCALVAGSGSVWADETTTCTFSTKAWAADNGGTWTSGKDGNQLTSGRGVQITTGVSGANGTSGNSFTNVSKIVVTYSTNATKGKGTIKVQVGSGTEQSYSISSAVGTDDTTKQFDFSPEETGKVKITVDCTENSIYIKSVAITCTTGAPKSANELAWSAASKDVTYSVTPYNLPTLTNPHSLAIEYGSTDESVATVAADGTVTIKNVTGSTTISAHTDGDATYASGTVSYTLNVTRKVVIEDGIFDFSLGSDYESGVTNNNDIIANTSSTWTAGNIVMTVANRFAWATSNQLKLYKAVTGVEAGEITISSPLGKVITQINFTGPYTGTGALSNITANKGTYTVSSSSAIWTGAAQSVTFTASNSTYINTISVTYGTTVPATIASSGFSTIAIDCALDCANLPSGLEAYKVSSISSTAATLEKVTTAVAANTGLILKGTASTSYTIPVVTSGTDISSTNKLKAAVTATACAANEVYILQSGLFHLVNAASTVPAGKAYLLASDISSAPEFLDFIFGDMQTTGVNDVRSKTADEFATPHSALQRRGDFFDLQGRKVANPKKGLYIVNGKKVAIK